MSHRLLVGACLTRAREARDTEPMAADRSLRQLLASAHVSEGSGPTSARHVAAGVSDVGGSAAGSRIGACRGSGCPSGLGRVGLGVSGWA